MPGLTRGQAISYIQQGLSWRTDRHDEILLQLDLTQREELEVGTTFPAFLIKRDVLVAGTALSPTLVVPADFIRNIDDGGLYWLTDGGGRRYLRKRPLDWMISFNQQTVESGGETVDSVIPTGDPMYYALLEGAYYVLPTPTQDFSLYSTYYAHDALPSALADDTKQNLWLANTSGLLVNLAGLRVGEDLQDDAAVAKFQRRYAGLQQRVMNENAMREQSDNEFKMGNQESWWN